MTKRRFPRSPELAPRPFDGGTNPFADDVVLPAEQPTGETENLYGNNVIDQVQPFQPGTYEPTLADRAGTVQWMGLAGVTLVAISQIILVVTFVLGQWSEALSYCFPTDLLGLALTVPAWYMASGDLRAIRAGAMDQAQLARTRRGYWFGCGGTLLGLVPIGVVLVGVVVSIL